MNHIVTLHTSTRTSPSRRAVAIAALAIAALIAPGDRSVFSASDANNGIDPLEILNLVVRPNILLVLSTSGTMRERMDANYLLDGNVNTPAEGETTGDDRESKLWGAKSTLASFIQANQTLASFQFATFEQSAGGFGPESPLTYVWATTDSNADGQLAAADGASRVATDKHTSSAGTTYFFYTDSYRVNQKIRLENATGNGTCGGWSAMTSGTWAVPTGDWRDNPPYLEYTFRSNGCTGGSPATVRYYLRGVRWNKNNGGAANSCGGFASKTALSSCDNNAQYTSIAPFLATEVTPTLTAVNTTTNGLRASGERPLAETLIDIKSNFDAAIWPNSKAIADATDDTTRQKTYVVLITDGDDTCDTATTLATNADNAALRAAHKAQQLYSGFGSPIETNSSVETFVIRFGTGGDGGRANWIAWGGSGMSRGTSGSGTAEQWTTAPSDADRAACLTCRDAILARDSVGLSAAMSALLTQIVSGEYSDQQSITETVYEFVESAPSPSPLPSPSPVPYHPLNPLTRYNATVPVLLQSTFEMPNFKGHLKAFRNNNDTSLFLWDAGQKLYDRLVATGGMDPAATYTFAQLHNGILITDGNLRTADIRIKRRIFTTASNLVNASYTVANLIPATPPAGLTSNRIALWPPAAAVAPADLTAGSLDAALGLSTLTTQADLQDAVPGACQGATLPAECGAAHASVVTRTRKEAREIILAHIAGAELKRDGDNLPVRDGSGNLLYKSRSWLLGESTLAAPGVVTPPLQSAPESYKVEEYELYRDGPRTADTEIAINAISRGMGLRNPDLDGSSSSQSDVNLKPIMSVVYHATNQMLHAFRAGPCPTAGGSSGISSSSTFACAGETGGEELFAFVPFDQLSKLSRLLRPQGRSDKTYMLAAPVRFADVFVPGSYSMSLSATTVAGTGVWRTIMYVGRGRGGKSFSALDITVPGILTKHSLETTLPVVVWNRGNYDTNDGAVKTASNSYVSVVADYNAYLKMGETWSVPAVLRVNNPANYSSKEFVLFSGSGYSDVSTEGKTFYVLDALTGNVLRSFDIADNSPVPLQNTGSASGSALGNSLVASPGVFAIDADGVSPAGFRYTGNAAEATARFVYFGDVHGQVWRYDATTPATAPTRVYNLNADGGTQPLTASFSILEAAATSSATPQPHLFAETGNERRLAGPTVAPFFKMFGFRDDSPIPTASPVPTPVASLVKLFEQPFDERFKGTTPPFATFADPDTSDNDFSDVFPVVFFAGTRYNTPSGSGCISSFDSIIYAFQGLTGLGAFELNSNGDPFIVMEGQRVNAVRVSGGRLVIDRGLGAQTAPPPPEASASTGTSATLSTGTVSIGFRPGTAQYQILSLTTLPWRTGSYVCEPST